MEIFLGSFTSNLLFIFIIPRCSFVNFIIFKPVKIFRINQRAIFAHIVNISQKICGKNTAHIAVFVFIGPVERHIEKPMENVIFVFFRIFDKRFKSFLYKPVLLPGHFKFQNADFRVRVQPEKPGVYSLGYKTRRKHKPWVAPAE